MLRVGSPVLLVVGLLIGAAGDRLHSMVQRDPGREVLARGDGWASLGEGVTGGASADADHVFVVRNRRELVAALSAPPAGAARIAYIDGAIDASVDDDNNRLTCRDYYRDGYTLEAFLAFYDPAGPWGARPPENTPGSLEAARRASAAAQSGRIRIRVPDNTTLVGLDSRARLRGAWLDVRGAAAARRTNVIIRNIVFEDVHDCFPAWTPRVENGAWTGTGEWDSEYDAIALREAERVWIDHNEFRDLDTPDRLLPVHLGARYQVHDGHVDVTNASDRVTVSWNRFKDHDKTMLIGSSDTAPADVGRLRVTVHHNMFEDVGQRAPRVRYGQVHVYNNYYRVSDPGAFGYSWGVGVQPPGQGGRVASGIYAENNFFWTDARVTPDRLIARFGGTALRAIGTLHNPDADTRPLDPVAAYNAARDPDLAADVGWVPALFLNLDPAHLVPAGVTRGAGPVDW